MNASTDFREAKILVLIVDDHSAVRDGIKSLIQEAPDIQVVGEATNGMEAITAARTLKPNVVLMDLSMPEMDGLEATTRLCIELPSARILMLTQHDDDHHKQRAILHGASGFLSKDLIVRDLATAIRTVAGGGFFF